MYESPIEIYMKQIQMKQDDAVLQAVQDIGVEVHKDELIKALQYDREQYDKGYADGQKDAKEELVDKIASVLEREENWLRLKHQCWLIGDRSDELRALLHEALKERTDDA